MCLDLVGIGDDVHSRDGTPADSSPLPEMTGWALADGVYLRVMLVPRQWTTLPDPNTRAGAVALSTQGTY